MYMYTITPGWYQQSPDTDVVILSHDVTLANERGRLTGQQRCGHRERIVGTEVNTREWIERLQCCPLQEEEEEEEEEEKKMEEDEEEEEEGDEEEMEEEEEEERHVTIASYRMSLN